MVIYNNPTLMVMVMVMVMGYSYSYDDRTQIEVLGHCTYQMAHTIAIGMALIAMVRPM